MHLFVGSTIRYQCEPSSCVVSCDVTSLDAWKLEHCAISRQSGSWWYATLSFLADLKCSCTGCTGEAFLLFLHPGPGNSCSWEFFIFFDGIGTGIENIARGTTDPEIGSETWTKLGNNMAPLALIANLATRWRHLTFSHLITFSHRITFSHWITFSH